MMRTFKSGDAKATRLAATFNLSDDGSDGSECWTQIGINLAYGVENHLLQVQKDYLPIGGYQGLVGYSDDGTNDALYLLEVVYS